MVKVYFGCDEVEPSWSRYVETCNSLEVRVDRGPDPAIKTLNRWRVETPRGFCFVLQADPRLGQRLDELAYGGASRLPGKDAVLEEALAVTEARAHALAARALLLETPPGFTPGADAEALLEALVAQINERASKRRALIWEPGGLWTVERALEVAEPLGLTVAHDPFLAAREDVEAPTAGGDVCYVLTERAAMRRRFDQFDMEEIIDRAEDADRAFVLLRGRFKWHHARELRHVLAAFDVS